MKAKQQTASLFVERMGLLFEAEGLTRIAGRIYGHLMLAPEPQSLDDLALDLKVSKGSASQDTRMLERMGVLERVTVPGDRRVYFQVSSDGHDRILTIRQEHMEKVRGTLELGLNLPAARRTKVAARLESYCAFYEHMIGAIVAARREWLKERKPGARGSTK